jgi:hypothetical protein
MDRRSEASSGPVQRGALREAPGGLRGASGCGAWGGARLRWARGARARATSRRSAAAPWLGRIAGPLFEHVFLQKFVLKCIK